jgi:hypothetical protein
MKCVLNFDIGHCRHLQSLCNRSSVSVTAGTSAETDILELSVGRQQLFLNFIDILEMTPF